MKIALIGYGKMGKLIGEIALQNHHQIVSAVNSTQKITEEAVAQADVCIDFSHPDTVLKNIKQLAEFNKNIVVGTTGWYDHIDTVKHIVEANRIGLIYSPNFSIGIHLFLSIVKHAAMLINHFDEYDIGASEIHHNKKVDSPSGTAKALTDLLINHIDRKKTITYDKTNQAVDELNCSILRCGSNPGFHSVTFDSPADTVTISHQARNREGFARGALTAAEWLHNKKGLFTLQDLLGAF